jgi:hypothetical protein
MGLAGKLLKASIKYGKSGTNTAWKAQSKIRRTGRKIEDKIHKSNQKVFRNAEDLDDFHRAKALKDKKHVANRSKQVTRITDSKKRMEKTKNSSKDLSKKTKETKGKSLKRTTVAATMGAAAGALYEAKTGNVSKGIKKVVDRAKTIAKKK